MAYRRWKRRNVPLLPPRTEDTWAGWLEWVACGGDYTCATAITDAEDEARWSYKRLPGRTPVKWLRNDLRRQASASWIPLVVNLNPPWRGSPAHKAYTRAMEEDHEDVAAWVKRTLAGLKKADEGSGDCTRGRR